MCVVGDVGYARRKQNMLETRVLMEKARFLDILQKCRCNHAHARVAYRLELAANRPDMLGFAVCDF